MPFGFSKLEFYALLAIVLLSAGAGWFIYHDHVEIQKGRDQIEASDKKAGAALDQKVQAETAHKAALAAQAHQGALDAQKAVDDFAAAHPTGPVRLCTANPRSGGLPQAGQAGSGATGAVARPDPLQGVPGRDAGAPGPDISPDLDALVLAAQRLAIIDREWQQRRGPAVSP